MTTATPVARKIITVELAELQDNPWQPRALLTDIEELAADIAARGLDQMPAVRAVPAEGLLGRAGAIVYQLVYGHRRVVAMRQLGWPSCEVELRELSDQQMAVAALAENTKRKDITPIEQYAAWRKALAIEGMTVQSLADSIGLDHSTVSNNLRVLELPAYVLALVEQGDLSVHGAREFLRLRGSDGHFHDAEAREVIARLTRGRPDWRYGRVRYEIADVMRLASVRDFRKLFGGHHGNGGADPEFDVEAFKREHAARVHAIPDDEWSWEYGNGGGVLGGKLKTEKTRDFTCATSAWQREQKAATAETALKVKKVAAKAAPEEPAGRSKDFGKTLANDPLFKAVAAETGGRPGTLLKAFADPEKVAGDVAAQLGTRAAPVVIEQGAFARLVDPREDNYGDVPYSTFHGASPRPPSYFPNIEECRLRCIVGATYSHFDERRPLLLWCLNQEHYAEKLETGRAKVEERLAAEVAKVDDAQGRAFAGLDGALDGLGADALRLVAAALLAGLRLQSMAPSGVHYREQEPFRRWAAGDRRILELLDVAIATGGSGGWQPDQDDVARLAALGEVELRELVRRMLAAGAAGKDELHAPYLKPFLRAGAAATSAAPAPEGEGTGARARRRAKATTAAVAS